METYTLRIQSKPYMTTINNERYVIFKGNSEIDLEPGKRKELIHVARTCYCKGNIWSILRSKRNIDRIVKEANGSALKAMSLERHIIGLGRKVIVKGITDESRFGKKGMLVTYTEVIVPQEQENTYQFNEKYGFAELKEKEF